MENNAWEIVKVSRDKNRPNFRYYINRMFYDFVEINGDRCYGKGRVIIGGFAKLNDYRKKVMIVGHNKEKDPKKMHCANYGQPLPEDFRKALRLMKLAEKYSLPIVTFIDTPGAHASKEAEERGIAYSIAKNLLELSRIRVPILTCIIGEGGSGGALGIAIGDRVLMQEKAYYSVISPEGCSSILWKKKGMMKKAAEVLRLRAEDLFKYGIIDEIIKEPGGGAHKDGDGAVEELHASISRNLEELLKYSIDELLEKRQIKWRKIGSYFE